MKNEFISSKFFLCQKGEQKLSLEKNGKHKSFLFLLDEENKPSYKAIGPITKKIAININRVPRVSLSILIATGSCCIVFGGWSVEE